MGASFSITGNENTNENKSCYIQPKIQSIKGPQNSQENGNVLLEFSPNNWADTDWNINKNNNGNEIKNILSRIKKLQLSPYAQKLLFEILLTNAYSPKSNLSNEEFLEIKIKFLISKNQKEYLEKLLLTNPAVGKKT